MDGGHKPSIPMRKMILLWCWGKQRKVTPCNPLCDSKGVVNATVSHTIINAGPPHPVHNLAQFFHRAHPEMKWDAQCCMGQLAVCVTAVHQWILLHTSWCWHPARPLWLFSQLHSFLAAVFWPSWNHSFPQRWICGCFAWLSKINPQSSRILVKS